MFRTPLPFRCHSSGSGWMLAGCWRSTQACIVMRGRVYVCLVVLCESGRGLPDTEGHVRSLSLVASQMCWCPVGRVPREIRAHGSGDHVLNGAGVRIGVPQRVVDGLSADGARKLVAGSVFAYGLECSCAAVPFPSWGAPSLVLPCPCAGHVHLLACGSRFGIGRTCFLPRLGGWRALC